MHFCIGKFNICFREIVILSKEIILLILIYSFRQDGIAPNPAIPNQDGISPFAPIAHQFYRFAQTLRLIPGDALTFPNNSITDVERVCM